MVCQWQPVLRVNCEGASSILSLGAFSMDILILKSGQIYPDLFLKEWTLRKKSARHLMQK